MSLSYTGEDAHQRRSATLAAEANHRIANSLAAIAGIVRLEASDPKRVQHLRSPSEVRNFLAEISLRIDTAAELHRLLALSDHGSDIDLSNYLLKIVGSVVAANAFANGAEIDHCLGENCALPSDQALAVGLIVAELVTNSLKYAHPAGVRGKISVRCEPVADGLTIEVADDGVGLPEGFDPETAPSLGFRLMRALSRQLGANLTFDSDMGLTARLTTGCGRSRD